MTKIKSRIFTDDQIEFIIRKEKVYAGELKKLLNAEFGTNFSTKQVSDFRRHHNINRPTEKFINTNRKKNYLMTEEQQKFIKENALFYTNKEMAANMNKVFGTSYTVDQVKWQRRRLKLPASVNAKRGWFKPGQEPYNKGKKNLENLRKGKIGDEIITATGMVYVKTNDDTTLTYKERWTRKPELVMKKAGHKVDRDSCFIFLDGNTTNCVEENIIIISQSERRYISKLGVPMNTPEERIMAVSMARICSTTRRLNYKYKGKYSKIKYHGLFNRNK
ncbi:TPA: hypothetical protein ACGOYX_001742 [Streptococcus suis]